ncbi:alpha/beta fold hydrolase [Pseudoxanthomonas sacheonensis]|uniref:Pimeloyl-ACP methyl ester carboxylesterase n=1 Tax=Pseudoxanthomonas sacheonensis TaxID=443615 RepID=A0ABU1RPI1_9GAMM|nr:alpha/beta fold hydrolase [Pseudoxanthomonas sacheonensis]MDR6840522.1 pimeloyl-ACP methyl ester carboxylesterase [Pseudoxanthomonas sacheonensis]
MWFGDEENLVAIVSEPSPPKKVPNVLILNAGVLHRVGPHRLHVHLARSLAAAGHRVARLDLSGIGDSRALPGRMTFRESSVADIRTTLDSLVDEGDSNGFILFGVCSGADNALAAAQADPRIRGLVLVDPPAYATPGSKLRHARGRLEGGRAWLHLPMRVALAALRRGARVLNTKLFKTRSSMPVAEGGRELPPIEEYRRQLNALVQRDIRILAIYSGVLGARYNHEDQLFEAFPELKGKVDCVYFPDANHTFTELSAQAALQARVLSWCKRWEAAAP